MAGVMFNLLGEKDGTECFSRMSVAAHGPERDCGHCGTFTIHYDWTAEITITEGTNGSGAGIDRVTVAPPANLAGSGKLFVRRNVAFAE